jgi:Glucodextranase, domain B
VPAAVTGLEGYSVRLYVTLPDAEADLVTEEPVGATSVQVLPNVQLANGHNDFQASIMGPGGESDLSAVTTVVLDTSKPKVIVISPKDNAQVTRPQVTIKGKSQAGSSVRLQNGANGAIATVKAGKDGLWDAVLAVANGNNVISITATDQAGNTNTGELRLVKGSGVMTASLSGSSYRFRASKLPKRLTLTVSVLGADGKPLAGATALFTISVPGLEAIVSGELTTSRAGTASFSTMIPKGATKGGGLATVIVTAKDEDDATDRQVLTFLE